MIQPCALCSQFPVSYGTTTIDGVLLCHEHARIAAMKRPGLTEQDLAGEAPAAQED